MKSNSLSSNERLKSQIEIDKIFSKESKSIRGDFITLRYTLSKKYNYPLQVGFSVSKRLYKKAKDRNQIKRWLREAFRTQKHDPLNQLQKSSTQATIFFLLQRKLQEEGFAEIELSMKDLLDKFVKRIAQNENNLG